MRLVSWNVNGIRAAHGKGLAAWLLKEGADIVCLQETKASPNQVPAAISDLPGHHTYFSSPERRGYSGVGLISRKEPEQVRYGMGDARFDSEGRIIEADYGAFTLLNVYFPNGGASPERLRYKLDFYEAFFDRMERLRSSGQNIILCGDVNTAHTERDIARPKENENHTGFLPVERAWLDRVFQAGYVDTFRMFNQEGGHYTWWDMKTRARERNVGWRLDYFIVSESLREKVKSAGILSSVQGSDHCPITLEIGD
jgi:exodeoxyribonuclease III